MKNQPIDVIEFLQDDALGGVSPLARLLFLGLCCQVNAAGDTPDRPRRIAGLALPYDTGVSGDDLLAELERAGIITRSRSYDDDDENPTIEIVEFRERWLLDIHDFD